MLNELKETANITQTENGAKAYRSTRSACLNFFVACGAMRGIDRTAVLKCFARAYVEDADLAMRSLFYARDVRGGLGERDLFRDIVRYTARFRPESILKNLALIPEYGRYDDLLVLLGTPCEGAAVRYIQATLEAELAALREGREISLLAKWLPSVNTSSAATRSRAVRLCRLLGMREREYRRVLSALRARLELTENYLRRRDYTFDYEKVPSKAMLTYRKAFEKRDEERYEQYLEQVQQGNARIKAEAVYPYEIVRAAYETRDRAEWLALDAQWKALPAEADHRNALVVVDGSGSMYMRYPGEVIPICVALSLGIYFAERNHGEFANHFITFSQTPQLVEIQGNNIAEKVFYCSQFDEVANTDLYAVFELLLKTAITHHLPQSDMPELLYIISDMEFDRGIDCEKTVYEQAKERFAHYGYRLPRIIYWKVGRSCGHFPVQMYENGVALVSGASPALFRQMMEQDITPYRLMLRILASDRYCHICA